MEIPIDQKPANVTVLKVKKRPTGDDAPQFEIVRPGKCDHASYHSTYSVNVEEGKVFCKCGVEISPIFALAELARAESRYRQGVIGFAKIRDEVDKRTRTKCQHCGKMTRIKGIV